jgi:hypothetical protein
LVKNRLTLLISTADRLKNPPTSRRGKIKAPLAVIRSGAFFFVYYKKIYGVLSSFIGSFIRSLPIWQDEWHSGAGQCRGVWRRIFKISLFGGFVYAFVAQKHGGNAILQ